MAEFGAPGVGVGRDVDPPRGQRQKPGKRAQKRRFAGAVRAGDEQSLARGQPEAEFGKDHAAAAFDAESRSLDLHA